MMRERLPELGFGERSTDLVARLIRYHLRPGELVRNWPSTDHAVRRFVADLDGHVLPLLLVNLADGWATRGPGYTREHFRRHCTFINYVLERAWAVSEQPQAPLLTGDDLIGELDLSGGRLLGAVLTSVREAQSRGEIHDRAEALRFAKSTLDRLRQDAATGV
jgi:poly(A) polymerase/tRNA nucleotidyltransferase (CCA-adding enzyme)